MKNKTSLFIVGIFFFTVFISNAQNVGVGVDTPRAAFNVGEGKTVLFGRDTISSVQTNSFIWFGNKGALAAGTFDQFFDPNSVGRFSFAYGSGSYATGEGSVCLGSASGATGYLSAVLGGGGNTASGQYSACLNGLNGASGYHSTAMGYTTYTSQPFSLSMGQLNIDVPNAVLMIGNGDFDHLDPEGFPTQFRSNVLTLLKNGRMGINTTTPIAPLHIAGSGSFNSSPQKAYWFNATQNTGPTLDSTTAGNWTTGLYVENDIVGKQSIVSSQTVTVSDARIKNIIGASKNSMDLKKLLKLQVTNYTYKDVAQWGNKVYKKFIAQQVEEVYPEAVKKQTSTIPDIYCLSEKVSYDTKTKELTVFLAKAFDIKPGDKIQIIHPARGNLFAIVKSVNGRSFSVENWDYPADQLFVYGKEVNDFRAVDYEALSVLGISAIQQLAKENENLKKQILELKRNDANNDRRIRAIEMMIEKNERPQYLTKK